MSNVSHLLSTREAAEALGLSIKTITRYAHNGTLTPVHKGDGVRGPLVFDSRQVAALRDELQKKADAS